ncbi:hypothetical protein [Neobacillus sp. 19]|uniref:hypothetical protein n=1 Tax=Neobacillus sp. 19 TaxID=3394458 RepID=UPI003BF66C5A
MYERTNIFFNAETSKIYSNETTGSPLDIEAYEVVNGVIQNHYDSPYHGDYNLGITGKISPDGTSIYNTGGVVFELATYKSGDMNYRFSFGKKYNDYEFSQEQGLTFAASTTTGIDVYQYDTKTFLYSLRKDLNVQKLHIQNGILVTINQDSSGNYFIETMNADTPPSSGVPEIPGIPDPVGTLNNLGFKPNDTAMDPNNPVIYMTKMGSKTVYAVNISTGEIKSLALPYPAERLELYKNKLYVTQHKMTHQYVASKLIGAIAEVDIQTFKLTKVIDVDADPYDIAIDQNGYIYIAPGSDQWEDMKVYSLATGGEIPNTYIANMRAWSYLYFNPESSKIYSISTDTSPRDVDAFEVENGIIKRNYNSPYHGDYPLEPFAKITPDGQRMYNNSGVVFDLAMYQTGDLTYAFKLERKYTDYEFSLQDQLTFAARVDGGIDVYEYNTNKYLYTIKKEATVEKLHLQNGKLTAVSTDSSGKYNIITMDTKTQGTPDTPSNPETPTDPGTPSTPIPPKAVQYLEGAIFTWNDEIEEFDYYDHLTDGAQKVPLDSIFGFHFDQKVEVNDESGIIIKGPGGIVDTFSWVSDDGLFIAADVLNGTTAYTLTIKKDALSGPQGQSLANDIIIKFTTASNWEFYYGKWHFYDPAIGDYATGWKDISGTRYYFNHAGEMLTGWQKINSIWYYFAGSGAMQKGWLKLGTTWYYLDASGAMKTGWLKQGTTWYYLDGSGAMKTGWLKQGTTWYYLDGSGSMKSGWLKLGTTWYYLNSSGAMKTGWLQLGKDWYYLYSSGAMAYNTKIGGYRLGANGAWIR